ncbi:hypothetical protein BGX29_007808 [Mortierella sp. GBA35]|nr:hypothetical protein BGX23_005310 [Mortierella sp. AD031]KAF9106985.1 hypothetical protein BGX29_007808 [Mortierella sp. GBA35]KAG0203028.1 hypothetical protein BGX33_009349 [Mortierella sp. NVP41]
MKFITSLAVAATTVAAFASAQSIAINDPNVGGIWRAGQDNYMMWGGSCKSLGVAAKNVTVQLMTGPAEAIRFIAELGTLDCSSEASVNKQIKLPEDIEPGNGYSLRVLTTPPSYSNIFSVVNPKAATPPPATAAPAPAPSTTQKPADGTKGSGAGSLAAGSMIAAAGAAVAALQFIL